MDWNLKKWANFSSFDAMFSKKKIIMASSPRWNSFNIFLIVLQEQYISKGTRLWFWHRIDQKSKSSWQITSSSLLLSIMTCQCLADQLFADAGLIFDLFVADTLWYFAQHRPVCRHRLFVLLRPRPHVSVSFVWKRIFFSLNFASTRSVFESFSPSTRKRKNDSKTLK